MSDAALAGTEVVGRYKNDDYKLDAEWQRHYAIYLDLPGELASQWLMARMRAIFAMEDIELRISC